MFNKRLGCIRRWPAGLPPVRRVGSSGHKASGWRQSGLKTRAAASGPPDSDSDSVDLNQLQSRLNVAIAAEDYQGAALLRDQISEITGAPGGASWADLGAPEWLAERCEQLGYIVPTGIQLQALQASLATQRAGHASNEAASNPTTNGSLVISSITGSGKTLAFLLPTLSALSYPPDTYPDDLQAPQAVIVVPHRELGVQIVMLIFRLFGGSPFTPSRGPGSTSNMFRYTGPRGIKVRGCLDKEEVLRTKTNGWLRGCHVVVGTPDCLAECLTEPQPFQVMQQAKVLVVDEADVCVQQHTEAMQAVVSAALKEGVPPPRLIFAGATLGVPFIQKIQALGWSEAALVVGDVHGSSLPTGLRHRVVTVPAGVQPSSALAKLVRADASACGDDALPPRTLVFAKSTTAAQELATPLRKVLWGLHRIGLLLPQGEMPTKVLEDFRANITSMLIVSPQQARGLDLPAVNHVYNMGVPADATQYVHRAGRVGRIGADAGAVVTTIATEQEVPAIQAVLDALNLEADDNSVENVVEFLQLSDDDIHEDALESAKAQLDDLYNLY